MSDFEPGQIVDIKIYRARVVADPIHGAAIRLATGEPHGVLTIPLNLGGLAVEHAVPEVHPGDLWRDRDGTLWFGVEGDDGGTYMMCGPAYSLPVIDASREWGPLTPVHQEGRS